MSCFEMGYNPKLIWSVTMNEVVRLMLSVNGP